MIHQFIHPCVIETGEYYQTQAYDAFHMLFVFSQNKVSEWEKIKKDCFSIGLITSTKGFYPLLLENSLIIYEKIDDGHSLKRTDKLFSIIEQYGANFYNGGILEIETKFEIIEKVM